MSAALWALPTGEWKKGHNAEGHTARRALSYTGLSLLTSAFVCGTAAHLEHIAEDIFIHPFLLDHKMIPFQFH